MRASAGIVSLARSARHVLLEARHHHGRRSRRRVARPRPPRPPRPKFCPVTWVSVHAASLAKPSNLICLTATSVAPRFATTSDTRHVLPRHDDAVVGQRLDADPARGNEPPAGTRVPSGAGGTRSRTGRSRRAPGRGAGRAPRERCGVRRRAAAAVASSLRVSNFFCAACTARGHGGEAVGQALRRLGAGELRQARDRRVDAVEQRSFRRAASGRGSWIRPAGRSASTVPAARATAPCPGTCACCALRCRCPRRSCRAARSYIDELTRVSFVPTASRLAREAEPGALVELLRLPRPQPVLDLLGILRRRRRPACTHRARARPTRCGAGRRRCRSGSSR